MAKDDALHVLSSEFRLWGVKLQHRMTDGGHIELRWQASPDKEARSYFIAKTPSDGRGTLNARAEIRRLFRADGLNLKQEVVKQKPVFQKALAIPEPIEKDADQIKMLRAEVCDLTDMLLDVTSTLTMLKNHILGQMPAVPDEAPIEIPAILSARANVETPPPSSPVKKRSTRSIKTIEYVTTAWNSTEAIARDMELPRPVAYMKLHYLKTQGVIELDDGHWRRKPPTVVQNHERKKNPQPSLRTTGDQVREEL